MVQSIWEDIKQQLRHGNMVTRLILINISVFILVWMLYLLLLVTKGPGDEYKALYETIIRWFCMSADWQHLFLRPWELITNMFLHEELLHLVFNMLFLYWFGRIVGDFIGDHRVLPIYLTGGLAGALLFFLSANVLNIGQYALGASAGVMAMAVAAAVIAPDYSIRLLLFGEVRLKFIVLVLLILDLVAIGKNSNTGGHISHLGGALAGALFVLQLRAGNDWAIPINRFLDKMLQFFRNLKGTSPRPGPRVVYRNPVKAAAAAEEGKRRNKASENNNTLSQQEQIDAILDKIKQSGYNSLNDEEKEFLFNASKKK